jgi:hypothetical protein
MDLKASMAILVSREDQARLEYPEDTVRKVKEVRLEILDSRD